MQVLKSLFIISILALSGCWCDFSDEIYNKKHGAKARALRSGAHQGTFQSAIPPKPQPPAPPPVVTPPPPPMTQIPPPE